MRQSTDVKLGRLLATHRGDLERLRIEYGEKCVALSMTTEQVRGKESLIRIRGNIWNWYRSVAMYVNEFKSFAM